MYIITDDQKQIISVFRSKKGARKFLRRHPNAQYRMRRYAWYSTIAFFTWVRCMVQRHNTKRYNRLVRKWKKLDRKIRDYKRI